MKRNRALYGRSHLLRVSPIRLAVGIAFLGVGCYLMFRGPEPAVVPAPPGPSGEASAVRESAPATTPRHDAPVGR
jgi:hypothetical protein